MNGKVKWFKKEKGYGFIEGEDGVEYFVHLSQLPEGLILRQDDEVTFEPAESDRGKQATNVALAEKEEE